MAGREIEETGPYEKKKNILERPECSKSQKVGAGYILAHYHYKELLSELTIGQFFALRELGLCSMR